jgi:antitoxin (DNA-binding transcriptional repressor) of toxin-antitoxin stability system
MSTVTLEQLQQNPLAVVERVEAGEVVVVTRADRQVIELRPVPVPPGKRPYGLAAGEFRVPDDINDPLPSDLLRAFDGR